MNWSEMSCYLSTRPTRHPPPRLIFQQVPTLISASDKTRTTTTTTITNNTTNTPISTTKDMCKATYHHTIAMVTQ